MSSTLGGLAAVATRFVVGTLDPVTIAAFRFGGAAAFYLWIFALELTTPTRVANTMTVNPIAASIGAALVLGEPIGLNVLVGIAAVFVGIWLASTNAGTT